MARDAADRFKNLVREWAVEVETMRETSTSMLAFGVCESVPVVLKVLREPGDEWRSGKIAHSFQGKGVVRVRKYVDGATLLERILPGTSLVGLVLAGRDQEATRILCEVILEMGHVEPRPCCVTVNDWSHGFDRYLESRDSSIPQDLVTRARDTYIQLCSTQRKLRLLHGDLHHHNVLFDEKRGWLAIDPKGVVGELEYEVGAALRNPFERPDVFVSRDIVRRRITLFEKILPLDGGRVLRWAFAQAVLSAIWCWEDQAPVGDVEVVLALAQEMESMF